MRALLFCISLGLAMSAVGVPPKESKPLPTKNTAENIALYRKIANDTKRPAKEREEALRWLIKNRPVLPYWLSKDELKAYNTSLLADYQSLLLLCPDDGKLHYEYAIEADKSLDSTVVLNAYARALRLGHLPAAAALGRIYNTRGDFETAIPYWKTAVDFEPANTQHWLSLARAQYFTNDFEAAADSYSKAFALGLRISDRGSLKGYSQALLNIEQHEEAITIAKKLLTYYNDTDSYLFVARIFADAGQPENAIFYYVRALEDASNRSSDVLSLALNNYAWFFCTTKNTEYQTPEYLLKAFRMSVRSVLLSKRTKPEYLDTLAEIYFLLGFPAQAIKLESEALKKDPGYDFLLEQIAKYEASLEAPPLPRVDLEQLQSIEAEVAASIPSTSPRKW